MFWQNEEYATGLADIVLDSVLCVVDAVFGQQVSEGGFLFMHPIDILLANARGPRSRRPENW